MNLNYYENKLVFSAAAKALKKEIDKLSLKKDKVILGLCGGRSISSILNELKKENITWEKIHIFLVDERMVSINDAQSNFRLIRDSLKEVLPKENFHPFIYDKENFLKEYKNELEKIGDCYDFVILSSGEDGHIASLYPNHSSILDNSDFFIEINDSPKPPKHRMSISRKFLIKTSVGFLFFIGNGKSESLRKFLDEEIVYL
jgi:6-phosphogluconolactonase